MNVTAEVGIAANTADGLGESPLWSERDGVLYWIDIRAPALHRLDPASGAVRSWPLPELCGAAMLRAEGGLVLGLRSGLFGFDLDSGTCTPLLAPEPAALGNRLNDSKVDRKGRIWTGTMRDGGGVPSGALYRVEPDLTCSPMLAEIQIPNALCFSPDDRTMYFADTPDGRLRAYDFDLAEGRLGAMRIVLGNGLVPGKPDGATVDADGCIWSARYGGSCVARVTPDGRVDRVVELPASQVTCCAFGGSDLRTLYITTARQNLTPEQLAAEPLAGALFAVEPGVQGLPEPGFAG